MEKRYEIKVLEMEQSFQCEENETVLEALKRSGRGPVSYGCFGGGCGVCKFKVVSGDYCITKKMSCAHVTEQEKAEKIALMCCIKPCGNLVITRRISVTVQPYG